MHLITHEGTDKDAIVAKNLGQREKRSRVERAGREVRISRRFASIEGRNSKFLYGLPFPARTLAGAD